MTRAQQRELLPEAARRANWGALHGPMRLRRGQFTPSKISTGAEFSIRFEPASETPSGEELENAADVDKPSSA